MNQSTIEDSIMKMYSEVRTYDVHYSTIRTSVATFFLALSLSLGAFLIERKHHALAIVFPTSLLVMAWRLTGYFQRLIYVCAHIEKELEDLLKKVLSGHAPTPDDLKSLAFRGRWATLFAAYRYDSKEEGNRIMMLFTYGYVLASIVIYVLALIGILKPLVRAGNPRRQAFSKKRGGKSNY